MASDRERAKVLPGLAAAVARLRLLLLTTVLVQRADETLRVVEHSDGQISDRPATTAADSLIAVMTSQA